MARITSKILMAICILTAGSKTLYSQDQNHEVGIQMSSLNEFDFVYKKQKAENKFIRYRLLSTNIGYRNIENGSNISFSTGLAIGKEKRKEIADRFKFIHGIEPRLQLSVNRAFDVTQAAVQVGAGYVLGFQYDINSFYVNVEAIPSILGDFRYGEDGLEENFNINAGFNSTGVALTVAYKFKAKKN